MNVKDTAKIKKDELKVGDVVFIKKNNFIGEVVKLHVDSIKHSSWLAEIRLPSGDTWYIKTKVDGFWGEDGDDGWLMRVSNHKYRGCVGRQYDNFVKNI